MKIIDISMEITPDMTVYKNIDAKRPKISLVSTHEKNGVQETAATLNMHTGTHIDAPLHMIDHGKAIAATELSRLITPCRVLDLTDVQSGITAEDLKKKPMNAGDFILLKTRNSFTEAFDFDFVYVEQSGAEYLAEKGIIGVGIDALGIERSQPGHETHRILLGNDIPIIEGLRLKDVSEGEYTLVALPIKLNAADASLMRAVLLPAGSLKEK